MAGLGLGMGVLELGFPHHTVDAAAFSTSSSSSSAAYAGCGGAPPPDAYLYGLLPTSDSSAAASASVPATFTPVDDLLDFSQNNGLLLEAADVSSYTYHAAHHHLLPHHHHQQQAFHAAYGAAPAASDATATYSLFVDNQHHSASSAGSDLAAFPDDLYIPSEDAAELEWLSKFVDDSTDVPFHIPGISTAGNGFAPPAAVATTTANSNTNHQYNATTNSHAAAAGTTIITRVDPSAGVMIPGRARSKRSRVTAPPGAADAAAQVGAASIGGSSSHLAQQQLASPSSSSSSSSETKLPRTSVNGCRKKRETAVPCGGAAAGPGGLAERGGAGGGCVRRCTHCSSEKTPQWRTGPLGPKTLCNACGVRYKSGRLVPEYRPAASPTFILTQHSNSHRKVMELRRQKEILMRQQHQLDASPRGMATVASIHVVGSNGGILAATRPDLLLRDFEVC